MIVAFFRFLSRTWNGRTCCLICCVPGTRSIGLYYASYNCGSGVWNAASSIHSLNPPDGFNSRVILLCICISGPLGWAIVTIFPFRCSGVMIYCTCPLIIPGRRYRLPGWGFPRPSVQKTSGEQASKQATNRSKCIFQASVKHLVWVTSWAEPEVPLHSSSVHTALRLTQHKKSVVRTIIGSTRNQLVKQFQLIDSTRNQLSGQFYFMDQDPISFVWTIPSSWQSQKSIVWINPVHRQHPKSIAHTIPIRRWFPKSVVWTIPSNRQYSKSIFWIISINRQSPKSVAWTISFNTVSKINFRHNGLLK